MTHHKHHDEEEDRPRESSPNPTQQRMDEEGPSSKPADVSWDEDSWGETEASPHQGEQGQEREPA
jgi:hypothetical protein